jgi:TldD protein
LEQAVVQRTLQTALRTGGDFAEVFVEDTRGSTARLDDGRVEEMTSGRERGAGVRVVIGDTTGFAHTADLSENGLRSAAEAASAAAREGGGGARSISLTEQQAPSYYEVDVLPETVAKAAKVELLQRANDAARSEGAAITSVMAGYMDQRRRILVANSDGLWAEDDVVRTSLQVQTVATGDAGMQTGFNPSRFTRGWEHLKELDVEELARVAARQAIAKLNARPAPAGVLPVVIKSGSGGMMFHEACGHGLESDAILKQASVYAGRVGERVASPLVTLVDDGTPAGEWGSSAIDDEGRPVQRNVLIEDGVLTDYMWDFLRARKEGREGSSGNGRRQTYQYLPIPRMTNTYLVNGEEDPEEIIRQTPNGVYCAQLSGGQVNTTTGDFVFGMSEAYLIENGEITELLRDANLIGNGPDILAKIDAVANDFAMTPGFCGKDGQTVMVGTGQPTLRITGITIGGTAGA